MVNCAKCQNFILEGKMDQARSHLGICQECREFEKSLKLIEQMEIKTAPAPKPASLRETFIEAPHPSIFGFPFKLAASASLVVFILLVLLPLQIGEKKQVVLVEPSHAVNEPEGDFFPREEENVDPEFEIATELTEINQNLETFENYWGTDENSEVSENLISQEISDLMNAIDNFVVEV